MYEYQGEERREQRQQPRVVSEVWKWIAMMSMGIVLGGAPAYASLMLERVTLPQVDREISAQTGVLSQKLDDLKDSVDEIKGEVHEIGKSEIVTSGSKRKNNQ